MHRSCSSTSSLPSYGWISTNGSTIVYTFSPPPNGTTGFNTRTQSSLNVRSTTQRSDSRPGQGVTQSQSAPRTSSSIDDGYIGTGGLSPSRTASRSGAIGTFTSGSSPSESGSSIVSSSTSSGAVTSQAVLTFSYDTSQGASGTETGAIFTAGGLSHAVSQGPDPNTAVVDGTTLSVGGPPATFDGQTISAVPSGFVILPPASSSNPQPCAMAGDPQPISCPAANGTIYTPTGACIGSNASYVINCDTYYDGAGVQIVGGVSNPSSCIAQCTNDQPCVAVAYDDSTNTCFEKSTVAFGNSTASPGVVFAYNVRYGNAVRGSSASSPGSASSSWVSVAVFD